VELSNCAPSFGRYDFLIRRLHSLTGLIPIGGYLAFHLATNAAILDGLPAFQYRVDQIASLGPTTLFLLEWPFIFLPMLFHGVIGVFIVCRGNRNVTAYPYTGNLRYTLQRWTGVIAFAFILWHVFHMHGWLRFEWWHEGIARRLGGAQFDPADAFSAPRAIRAALWIQAFYVIGVLSAVYHLANGLWTFGITWGIWTSPNAQRWANIPAIGLGVFLAVVGIAALVGMVTVRPGATGPPTAPAAATTTSGIGVSPALEHTAQ
jgi:succinate dehydrogenase / fumarate reductase cytochrome b subunit